jgi:hypothetical protein
MIAKRPGSLLGTPFNRIELFGIVVVVGGNQKVGVGEAIIRLMWLRTAFRDHGEVLDKVHSRLTRV